MSKQDRSGKAKTKKHMKTSKKNKIIIILVVIALVLTCFLYFAHITGFWAKVIPGASIKHTVDGKEKTVKNVPIVEMNYYYAMAYSQMINSGIITYETDLDLVADTTSGQTYRQRIWETAANNVQQEYILAKAASDANYDDRASKRYAEVMVDDMRSMTNYYNTLRGTNMTMDQYLQSTYGPGMTVQTYRKIMQRKALIDEYTAYYKLVQCAPTQEEILAKYNEDPASYERVQIQAYFISANLTADTTGEEKTKALEEAEKKAHQIADNCVNAVEFQTKVKMFCTEEYRDRMVKGEDPTTVKDLTKEQLKQYNEEFAELCFTDGTKENTSMVFQDSEQQGAFAVLFEKKYIDEEPTAQLRFLQLNDDLMQDLSKTPEEKAESFAKYHKQAEEIMAGITSEDEFIAAVKENSTDSSTYINGGMMYGIRQDNTNYFKPTILEDGGDPVYPEEDSKLIEWLYSADRKRGDMIIIDCASSVKIFYYIDVIPGYQNDIRTDMITEKYNDWYNGLINDPSYSTVVNNGLIDFFT